MVYWNPDYINRYYFIRHCFQLWKEGYTTKRTLCILQMLAMPATKWIMKGCAKPRNDTFLHDNSRWCSAVAAVKQQSRYRWMAMRLSSQCMAIICCTAERAACFTASFSMQNYPDNFRHIETGTRFLSSTYATVWSRNLKIFLSTIAGSIYKLGALGLLRLGRQRQAWFIPIADERGVCR